MNLEAKIIKPKLELLELSRQLGSVTQACKAFGYSRDSFYRFKKLYEEGGELALHDIVSLNRPNPKNRVDPEIESRVVKIALDNPALGQQRVSNELRKEGLFISPGGVRSVWQRHDLETFQKRLSLGNQSRSGRDHSNGVSAPSLGKSKRRKVGRRRD